MPICVRDPWRFQYFENIPCPEGVRVPVDDIDCWEWFPEQRKVYDKLHVAQSQGIVSGAAGEPPRHFPVFAKPRVNLKGMGSGSGVIPDLKTFQQRVDPDMMWMERLEGDHISTDCALVKGKVEWIRHATGLPWLDGMFKHWTIHAEPNAALAQYIAGWAGRELADYTGMINIETIGGRIIEAHLRFADQWCDLNGEGWIQAVVGLYHHGHWRFADGNPSTGYSVPLFARHGKVPPHPGQDVQREIISRPGISSLQITYHQTKPEEDHPMPPGGFRLAIVNCWDLAAGLQARRDLVHAFPGCDCLLPEV